MDTDEFRRRLSELVKDNPKSVRIMRSSADLESLGMALFDAMADSEMFENGDEAMLEFIHSCGQNLSYSLFALRLGFGILAQAIHAVHQTLIEAPEPGSPGPGTVAKNATA